MGQAMMASDDVAVLNVKLDNLVKSVEDLKKQNETDHAEVKAAVAAQASEIDGLKLFRERVKGVLIALPTVIAIAALVVAAIK